MIDSRGCPIEEEIPPNGMETTTAIPEPFDNANPSAHPTMAPGGCVVEEEIPPSWMKYWTTRNVPATTEVTHWLAMEETPPTEFDATTTQHEATIVSIEQALLNPHRFSDDHLQLIFEMHGTWRTNSTIRASSVTAWTSCSTPCPVHLPRSVVRLATNCLSSLTTMMEAWVRRTFSFSSILFYRNQLQSIFVFVKTLVSGYSHVYIFCKPHVLVSMHVAK
jgi:hypothetical protein